MVKVTKENPTTKHVFDGYLSADIAKGVFNTKEELLNKQFWTVPPKDQRFAMVN